MELRDVVTEAIEAHAEREFPKECCGLILSDGTTVQLDNISCEELSFEVRPEQMVPYLPRAEYLYHSHPNRPATASTTDIKACNELRLPFLIMSIPSGETVRQLPDRYIIPLLGRTFVYGVSDCFSLVTDFYSQKMNIMLPEAVRPAFGWWKDGKTNVIEDSALRMGFFEVTDPEPGDIILMQAGNSSVIDHMAVYIGDRRIIHHTLLGLSRISTFTGYWYLISKKVLRHVSQR